MKEEWSSTSLDHEVVHKLRVLIDFVLDVDLLGLVAGEGSFQMGEDTLGEVLLELITIKKLLALISGTEVEDSGSRRTGFVAENLTMLQEGTEGGKT